MRGLARRSGYSQAAVSQWEAGKAPISDTAWRRLEAALVDPAAAHESRGRGRPATLTLDELGEVIEAELRAGSSQVAALVAAPGGTERKRDALRSVLRARRTLRWSERRARARSHAVDEARRTLVALVEESNPTLPEIAHAVGSSRDARRLAGYVNRTGSRVSGSLEREGQCHWVRSNEFVGGGSQTRTRWRLRPGPAPSPTPTAVPDVADVSGVQLRATRHRLGLSLEAAASAARVSPSAFLAWENRGGQSIPQARVDSGLVDDLRAASRNARGARSAARRRYRRAVREAAIAHGEGTVELLRRVAPRQWSSTEGLKRAVAQLVARGELEYAGVTAGNHTRDGWRLPCAGEAAPDRISSVEVNRMLDDVPGTEAALARQLGKRNSLLQAYRKGGVPRARAVWFLEGIAAVRAQQATARDDRAARVSDLAAQVVEVCVIAGLEGVQEYRVPQLFDDRSTALFDAIEAAVESGELVRVRTWRETGGRGGRPRLFAQRFATEAATQSGPPAISGAELARRRRAAGLTQTQLAARLTVRKMTVWRWENGGAPLPLARLAQLHEILPEH